MPSKSCARTYIHMYINVYVCVWKCNIISQDWFINRKFNLHTFIMSIIQFIFFPYTYVYMCVCAICTFERRYMYLSADFRVMNATTCKCLVLKFLKTNIHLHTYTILRWEQYAQKLFAIILIVGFFLA